ncbi:MAG: glycosyltransferase [Candidatus Eisenbacteria bacterium]
MGGLGRTPEARKFGEAFIASVPASIRERVVFHGSLERPEEVVSRAGFLLLPSQAEGLPNVVLEAMACGTIPIVSDLPAMREAVGDCGFYVDGFGVADWRNAIESVLLGADALTAERDACRTRAETRFDLGATSARYEEIFQRLSAGGNA